MIQLKRVYDEPSPRDGVRILVDRLWPRGLTKERAAVDHWDKDVAPSTELRKWFGHDPARWAEFQKKYAAELRENKTAFNKLIEHVGGRSATLLYGGHDTEHNEAVVLKRLIDRRSNRKSIHKHK